MTLLTRSSVAPAPLPASTTVYVTASSVNARRDPSMAGEVLKHAKKNDALKELSTMEDRTKVQLADGTVGWVASRFVSQSSTAKTAKPGCNTGFAFVKTPKPSFAEGGSKHGLRGRRRLRKYLGRYHFHKGCYQ